MEGQWKEIISKTKGMEENNQRRYLINQRRSEAIRRRWKENRGRSLFNQRTSLFNRRTSLFNRRRRSPCAMPARDQSEKFKWKVRNLSEKWEVGAKSEKLVPSGKLSEKLGPKVRNWCHRADLVKNLGHKWNLGQIFVPRPKNFTFFVVDESTCTTFCGLLP